MFDYVPNSLAWPYEGELVATPNWPNIFIAYSIITCVLTCYRAFLCPNSHLYRSSVGQLLGACLVSPVCVWVWALTSSIMDRPIHPTKKSKNN